MIRRSPQGVIWVFLIIILAFCGDIAAYYVGRTMGKKKLLPSVSPGKTVEGTIALVVGSMAGVIIFRQLFLNDLSFGHAVILGFLGSIIGQLGDLCESALKREAGVKDSGSLLPGHGGIMDRLDCLIFIAPFVYYYRMFFLLK
jgi:phosphatidate cytidylyltransferase